jgi:hypothetical protein
MITEIAVSSMEELAYELNSLPNNFIFRGHADATWGLTSSLERFLGTTWTPERARKFESRSLDLFKSKYHIYCGNEHVPRSKLAWLSAMQHYGVPTRLVDFSESPYIALYFALEEYDPREGKDLAIYALDYSAIMAESTRLISRMDSAFTPERAEVQDRRDQIFDSTVDRYSYEIAWITEPEQLNARIDRQCGTFLISGTLEHPIEKVLRLNLYHDCRKLKYIVPAALYENIYVALRKMNINSKVIYGDLAGLARSIKMHLQIYTVE